MQKFLIDKVFLPLSKLTGKIPEKMWDWVTAISMCCIILTSFANSLGFINRYIIEAAFFCVFFGLIILAGIRPDMKPLKFSWGMLIPWLGTGAFILLTSVLVEPNNAVSALLWLAAVPVFYLVWGNRSFEKLVILIFNGIYAAFAVFLLISVIFFPIEGGDYMSFFANRNSLGVYAVFVYTVALIDATSQKKFCKRLVVASVVAGVAAALLLYSNSRGGQISAIAGTIFAVIAIVVQYGKKFLRPLARGFLPIALAVAIALPGCIFVFEFGFNLKNGNITLFGGNSTEPTTQMPTEPDTVSPTKPPTTPPTAPPAKDALDDILNHQQDRIEQNNSVDFNSFTSGRVTLWKAYWAEVGFLGHRDDHEVFYEDGSKIELSSHLTLLQIAYDYGILAAVFFLILNLVGGVKAVIHVWKHRDEAYVLLPLVAAVAYGSYYLVENLSSLEGGSLFFLYMLSQLPLITKKKEVAKVEEVNG